MKQRDEIVGPLLDLDGVESRFKNAQIKPRVNAYVDAALADIPKLVGELRRWRSVQSFGDHLRTAIAEYSDLCATMAVPTDAARLAAPSRLVSPNNEEPEPWTPCHYCRHARVYHKGEVGPCNGGAETRCGCKAFVSPNNEERA